MCVFSPESKHFTNLENSGVKFPCREQRPSNSTNTVVDIYMPTNDTADIFYLYLTNATAHRNGVQLPCDISGVNPQA